MEMGCTAAGTSRSGRASYQASVFYAVVIPASSQTSKPTHSTNDESLEEPVAGAPGW
jgi:hypothetical protein